MQLLLVALLLLGQGFTYAQTDTIQTNVPALKNVYAHDFRIGCLLSYRHIGFPEDPYVPGTIGCCFPLWGIPDQVSHE